MEKGRLAIEIALDDNAFGNYRCARNSASAHRQTRGGSEKAALGF